MNCDACSKTEEGKGLSTNLTKESRKGGIDKKLKKKVMSSDKKSKGRPMIEITKYDSREVVDFNCISSEQLRSYIEEDISVATGESMIECTERKSSHFSRP